MYAHEGVLTRVRYYLYYSVQVHGLRYPNWNWGWGEHLLQVRILRYSTVRTHGRVSYPRIHFV